VNARTGEVVGPSRMPGWHGSRPVSILGGLHGVPVTVENDARAAALGEFQGRGTRADTMIYVKAGTGIGAGLVLGGRLYTGAGGLAGDIAHVRVTDEPTLCACGRVGCLEAVASGAAIRSQLAADGVPTADVQELVALGQQLQPEVSAALRTAGDRLGRALAPLVNFLNPSVVAVGGALSGIDSFVASVRSALYDYCLPMCTQDLAIEAAVAGRDAALLGLGHLAADLATSNRHS
jgi:predicted NBD/HSP70 family sugar kinase